MSRINSNSSTQPATYALQHFMEYPNLAFRLAMITPFSWEGGNDSESDGGAERRRQPATKLWCYLKRLWFSFGALNLIYQNFGMLIYLFAPQVQSTSDNEPILGQISETGGIMGLTLVAACKMLMLFWHRRRIATLIHECQRLFPSTAVQRLQCAAGRRVRGDGDTVTLTSSRWLSVDELWHLISGIQFVRGQYHVKHFVRRSNLLMKHTTIFFIFAFCFYNSLPIVQCLYEFLSPQQQLSYRYQSNTWYPWQTGPNAGQSLIGFLAAYWCQVQSSLTGVAFIMAGEFMLSFFITQMQLHFDYLANALETLDARDVDANQQLKYLISYHNRLLGISGEINHIFNISFMVNFFTSSIAICLMSFSMVMISLAHAFKYSVGLLSFLVFTLFICYNGSEFTESSDLLMPAAFYNNWYYGNLAYRKMIHFFIMRSSKSNVLQAYKFATVSMPTYMAILKASYQLFTFFRAMY